MLDKVDLVLVGANNASGYWWDHTGWHWAMGLHGVFWLALIALAIATIVALSRTSSRRLRAVKISPRAALDTRYARGEIDRGEYLERKRDLS